LIPEGGRAFSLERDRRAFRVVLIIATPGVPRYVDNALEIRGQSI
jgi:hypothetical protein